VSQLKRLDRDFQVLEFLNVKPRTTYLARVRNPNPAMPDYYEAPLSFVEWNAGSTLEEHGEPEPGQKPEETRGSARKGAR
jgi:molybdopterin-containing oxidoreductase family iron-sulfur binding subunit